MQPISIGEAVEELRSQIIEAQAARPDGELSFEIVEAQLQIQGSLSRSVEGGGSSKVKFSVFGFGAEAGANAGASYSAETAHTVTLKLNVTDTTTGGRAEIDAETRGAF
ncbi:hypothetical protein GCM10007385_28310 [Tateyamaria omphalii]|uniref:trypco2 family protein n=1 Tax=Tateyamaria omphalii TaxID=299262 RepID=UPI00167820B5|nr:trypco2 family protein [Tateyamaria omphalii]GGX58082.1 hypothetical protein GCM10007385_28310 [Tateyamaria omphalii]